MSELDLLFSPLVPLWGLYALGLATLVVSLLRIRQSVLGALFRLLTGLLIVGFLSGPQLRETEGEPQDDIVFLFEDQSRSLTFGARNAIAADAADRVEAALEESGVEVRRVPFGDALETDLGSRLTETLLTTPRQRVAGAVLLTDGQLHGETPVEGLPFPVHTLLTGDPASERDRRIEILQAPRFGVVGDEIEIAMRVEATGETGLIPTRLLVNGETYAERDLPPGEEVSLQVRLSQPGETILELVAETAPGELTPLNNRGVAAVTAVRDRLRVLLVSGEPHAGERVWRNLLKSDAAVDLVHFTILKPAEKAMTARREELNLIEFPHQELFLDKLSSFDVVIFDRYTYRGVLQSYEFEEIARYVENGGAVLIAAGPEMVDRGSLANRPNLAYILPVLPNGLPVEESFVPGRSPIGSRHPITASLEDPGEWGRWLRFIPGEARRGQALMTAPGGEPLLVIDDVGRGRIAVLMSDHVWLWARGFDGGGPHQQLLRRLVHWLMKEPELEAEALGGTVATTASSARLTIERQALSETVEPVTVVDPDGTESRVTLDPVSPGRFAATVPAPLPGLYRLGTTTSGGEPLYALASAEGLVSELTAVTTTEEHVRPLAAETGGVVAPVRRVGAGLPVVRRVDAGRRTDVPGALVFPRRDARTVEAVRLRPLLHPALWLLLIGGAALAAWIAEGRRR